jgi:hypothetical protein
MRLGAIPAREVNIVSFLKTPTAARHATGRHPAPECRQAGAEIPREQEWINSGVSRALMKFSSPLNEPTRSSERGRDIVKKRVGEGRRDAADVATSVRDLAQHCALVHGFDKVNARTVGGELVLGQLVAGNLSG